MYGIGTFLIYCIKLELEVLYKSKKLPNTSSYVQTHYFQNRKWVTSTFWLTSILLAQSY